MEKTIVFATLGALFVLFLWGKIRYDIVSLIGLVFLTIIGIIPASDAFLGFGHPAVITVAAVLIITRALQNSGLVDVVANELSKLGHNMTLHIFLLSLIVAVLSAFMNNIAALAILIPVALQLSKQSEYSPSYILMPMAFASLLGGVTTLIGTPPNIIISTYRAEIIGAGFGFFDFAYIGIPLTIAGIAFIALIGWRLLPKRKPGIDSDSIQQIQNYITEVKVIKDSKIKGKALKDLFTIAKVEVVVLGIIRNETLIHAFSANEIFEEEDILIVEADTDDLKTFIKNAGVKFLEHKHTMADTKGSDEIEITEAVVMPNSPIIGQTAKLLQLRTTYHINLLAVSRRASQIKRRLSNVIYREGDILLLQGHKDAVRNAIENFECLSLSQDSFKLVKPQKLFFAITIFALSIALVLLDFVSVHVSFTLAAVVLTLTRFVTLKELYSSIDWPIIVLLGALIPVGIAFETSGAAQSVFSQILHFSTDFPAWFFLGIVMVITMLLSNLINNAATAVLMAPIAIKLSDFLNSSPDAFLMGIAIAASSAFLTPIGHQSNTLVMTPGGYKFSDYWKMGLPMQIIVLLISVPLLFIAFPL